MQFCGSGFPSLSGWRAVLWQWLSSIWYKSSCWTLLVSSTYTLLLLSSKRLCLYPNPALYPTWYWGPFLTDFNQGRLSASRILKVPRCSKFIPVFSQSCDFPHLLISSFEFQVVVGKPHLPGRNQIFSKMKSKIGGQEWWCIPTTPALRRERQDSEFWTWAT